jgi:hypothetical protein
MIENAFQPIAPVNRVPKIGLGLDALQAESAADPA